MNDLLSVLTSSESFEERFEQHCRSLRIPHKKAYEATERELEKHFGRRHYSNFESFKRVRARRNKR